MMLRDTIDDLDSVIAELADLRQALIVAEQEPHPADVLWDIEYALLRASARAAHRADSVHRVIELLGESRTTVSAAVGPQPG